MPIGDDRVELEAGVPVEFIVYDAAQACERIIEFAGGRALSRVSVHSMLSGESLSDLYDRDCQWFRDKIAHETGCQDVSVRWLGPAFTLFANSAFIVSELARDSAASTCRSGTGHLACRSSL